ncbi:aspartate/glutamate racemase family protein [Microbacterium dauci]|uniref:Aspartate/glutamate racemase family protein n=1 Tax=Microbacterium dauci TaxID=3048008 RepID=A0ABT6ZAF1_9MICO|nr:aspartate/glutamate racemase family protein [Microbacterium sp. LX3-4]MDJ1113133.1 aspartate/glutamate racemase family protein [Microbacterium sp. LX3-4]
MKTIGMLGGMSWESTELYYRLANQHVRERVGGLHSAPILLDSVDFAEVAGLQRAGDWDAAGRLLAGRAERLAAGGADLIVLCTNTMHKVIDDIERAVDVPVVHIADATAAAIAARGIRRVGLLGTAFTMEQPFYRERMATHGIEVVVPDAADRALVHRVIFDELVHGVVDPDSRRAFAEIVDRLVAAGADGVILGCTEIELLIGQDEIDVPVFPTAAIHVAAAVDLALA